MSLKNIETYLNNILIDRLTEYIDIVEENDIDSIEYNVSEEYISTLKNYLNIIKCSPAKIKCNWPYVTFENTPFYLRYRVTDCLLHGIEPSGFFTGDAIRVCEANIVRDIVKVFSN